MTQAKVVYQRECRNRIRVAAAAYAYEVENDPIMSDAEYDALAKSIRPSLHTGEPELDAFFARVFSPDTGVWVHHHPDKDGLRRVADIIRRTNGTRRKR